MHLHAGEECNWPSIRHKLEKGELLILLEQRSADGEVLQRERLVVIEQGEYLIDRPELADTTIELKIRAIKDCSLIASSEGRDSNNEPLLRKIKAAITTGKKLEDISLQNTIQLFWEYRQEQRQQQLGNERQLNSDSETELFIHLEQAARSNHTPKANSGKGRDPLEQCVDFFLKKDNDKDTTLKIPTRSSDDSRTRLRQLLDTNDLIGRDVILQGNLQRQDCGDLIAFMSDDQASPIALISTSTGYQIWIPGKMEKPAPLKKNKQLLEQINPRAISVHRTFSSKNLTALGLLRFAYGSPQNRMAFIVGGLLLGLALGFLLAIGREVGAARWIFGMGFTGLSIGASLGVLSGGFRVGVAVMLLATLLSLLTPTFNTIITNQALPNRDLGLLLQIAGILIAAGITRVVLEWNEDRSLLLPQQKGAVRTQLAGVHRLLNLPIDFFQKYSIGDLQLRFYSIDELRDEIQELLDGGLIKLVLSSIYILFLLRISVKLTLLAIVIAMMLVIPTAIIGIQIRPLQRKKEEEEAKAQTRNLEIIGSVSKLRLAGAETRAARWWAEHYKRSIVIEDVIESKEAIGQLLGSIIPDLGNLLLYIVIFKLISEALNTPTLSGPNAGQLLGFFSAFGTFIGATASLSELMIGAIDIPIIYERAKPILEASTENDDALLNAPPLKGEIEFDRVSYRYEPQSTLVLDQINFKAKPGSFVAIVGPSGSGKSTIVRLLLSFARPEEGTISFDGQQLDSFQPDSVRRQIGTVLQSNELLSGTLFEAISGGQIISQEEAWEAAAMAGLEDDIKEMPMQMQTVISEGGGTLSGGQQQRVAIARAIVGKPRLLIFDEATSALDNQTQNVVSQSLKQLEITRIVIAHRLSTIRHADQIIVLESGQIREQGDFDSLMRNKDLFAKMMERQVS